MEKKNTTAAAAKVAAAAKTNKVNAKAAKAAGVPAVLDAAKIAAAAKDAATGCHTCKEVAAKFADLVTMYGRDDAVLIQKAAKIIVTDAKTATTAAAAGVIDYLKDGANVARAAWDALLKEDRAAAQFARIVYDNCGRDLAAVVVRFASFVGRDASGRPVPAVRVATKDAAGVITISYKPRNLASVGGYLAALKLAVRNAKRAALGAKPSDYQTEVSF